MNARPNNVATIDDARADFEIEVLKSKLPVVVAFGAPWSRPCRVLGPVLEEVAGSCVGTAKIVKVNADDNPDLSLWYGVRSIPTLLYFVDGDLRATVVGTASKKAIISKMQSIIRSDASLAKGRE